jgi:protein-S-isoprenylcysteine O-methyltransferase Ste14
VRVYLFIIAACWAAFFVTWFVAALARGTGRSTRAPGAIGVRVLLLAAALLGVWVGQRLPALPFGRYTAIAAAAGCALCVAGLAFAVWARIALGRSWGMPMTLHSAPELVTAGPYRFVRHPIYTGLAAMTTGTALVFPPVALWALVLIAFMIYSARREERDMANRFPSAYAEYRRHSKMIVPFLF